MATPQNGDSFLVNRNGISYYVLQENLMASVKDDDLLLINRAGVSYKIRGDELKGSFETFSVDTPTMLLPVNNSSNINPNDITLTCTPYSAQPSDEILPYEPDGKNIWQISTTETFDEGTLALNVTNSNPTSYTLSTTRAETSKVATSVAAGDVYNLTFDTDANLDQFAVNEAVSCEATPLAPDMSGLRLGGNIKDPQSGQQRQSQLVKQINVGPNGWTISFWIKVTDNNIGYIVNNRDTSQAGDPEIVIAYTSGTIEFNYGDAPRITATGITQNEWFHLVFNSDGTQNSGWLNGVPISAPQAGSAPTLNSPFYIGRPTSTTTDYFFDGYLSAFYFVEGQALPASVFGYTDSATGKWAPKTPSEIDSGIDYRFAAQSPYSSRPIMTTDWSSLLSVSSGTITNADNAFDGNTATTCYGTAAANMTFDSTGEGLSGAVRIWTYVNREGSGPTISINGGDEIDTYDYNAGNVGGYNWVPLGTVAQLDTIFIRVRNSSDSAYIGAIEVDGRYLVNGPANNSQMWSDGVATGIYPAGSSWEKVFDGNLNTEMTQAGADPNTQSQYLVLDNPIPVPNGATVAYYAGGAPGGGGLRLNDSVSQFLVNVNGWTTVDGFSDATITQLQAMPGGDSTFQLKGIKVGDELIVDSGISWDTSEIWSNNVTTNSPTMAEPISASFNGNPYNGLIVADSGGLTNYTLQFDPPIGNGVDDKVEIFWYIQGSYTAQPTINGLTFTAQNFVWQEIPAGAGNQINSISCTHSAGVSATAPWAFRVNGVELVNNTPYGSDGFYLPFDPAADSALYSTTIDFIPTGSGGSVAGNMYNGLTNFVEGNYTSAPAGTNVWLSNQSIDVAKSVTMLANFEDGDSISINGNPVIQSPAFNGSYQNYTVDFSGTLAEISATTAQSCSVIAIYIDGVMLVDHSSAGADASGNNNNFADTALSVGNTDQVWSVESLFSGGWVTGDTRVKSYAFNGYKLDGYNGYGIAGVNNGGGTTNPAILSFNPPLENVTNLAIAMSADGSQTVAYNSETPVGYPASYSTRPYPIYNNAAPITVSSIQFVSTNPAGNTLYGIFVNGEQLIDSNIQDTVLDTPVTNYGVLGQAATTLVNGNLNIGPGSNAWSTSGTQLVCSNTDDYYFETSYVGPTADLNNGHIFGLRDKDLTTDSNGTGTGAWSVQAGSFYNNTGTGVTVEGPNITQGDVIGFQYHAADRYCQAANNGSWIANFTGIEANDNIVPFAGQYGSAVISTINVGQQPFAFAKNNMDGTCTVPPLFNSAKPWASYGSSADPTHPWVNAFNGDIGFDRGNYVAGSSSPATWDAGANGPDVTDTIKMYLYVISDSELKINGISLGSEADGGLVNGWNTFSAKKLGITKLETISIGHASGSDCVLIYGIEVDGTMLLDSSIFNATETWSDYVDTQLGYASQSPCNAFNGLTTVESNAGGWGATVNDAATWTPPTELDCSALRIYCNKDDGLGNPYFTINGSQQLNIPGSTPGWSDSLAVTGGKLQSIAFPTRTASNAGYTVWAIEVDGAVLINKGGGVYRTLVAGEVSTALTVDILTGTVASVSAPSKSMSVTPDDGMDWTLAQNNQVIGSQKTGLLEDTTYYARVKQFSTNGVESDFSAPTKFTTGAPPVPPTATDSYGLRYHGQGTAIGTNITKGSQYMQKAYTWNGWFKPTDNTRRVRIFEIGGYAGQDGSNNNTFVGCYWAPDTKNLYVSSYSSSSVSIDNFDLELNKWHNIQVCHDKNKQVKLYVDGLLVGQSNDFEQSWNAGVYVYSVGTDLANAGDPMNTTAVGGMVQGNMSAPYLITGAYLDPSVFTQRIDNVCQPLDSDVIQQNIKSQTTENTPKSRRVNADEVWAASGTLEGQYNVFDSSFDTSANITSAGYIKLFDDTPGVSVTINESLEFLQFLNPGYFYSVRINGKEYQTQPIVVTGQKQWNSVIIPEADLPITTSQIEVQVIPGSADALYAIRIDGRWLTNGPSLQDQEYSLGWTTSNDKADVGYVASNMFNGVLSNTDVAVDGNAIKTSASYYTSSSADGPSVFNFVGINNVGTVELLGMADTNLSSQPVLINSTDVNAQFNTSNFVWASADLGGSAALTSITVPAGIYINAVKINGELVLDQGLEYNIDEFWQDKIVMPLPLSNANIGTYKTYQFNNIFDGSVETYANLSGQGSQTITYSGLPTGEIRVYVTVENTSSIQFNQGEILTGSYKGWYKIQDSALTETIQTQADTFSGALIHAIMVDGKILKNNKAFGAEGYYLPFNRDADCKSFYSFLLGDKTAEDGFVNNQWYAFNGNLKQRATTATAGETLIWDVSNVTLPSGPLEVWIPQVNLDGQNSFVNINGAADIMCTPGIWSKVADRAEDVNELRIRDAAGTGLGSLFALRINGSILVDDVPIGQDLSGNGNNFYSVNFNSGNVSQVWSSALMPGSNWESGWNPEYLFSAGCTFNDSVSTPNNTAAAFYVEWNFENVVPGGIPFEKSVRIAYQPNTQINLIINGDTMSEPANIDYSVYNKFYDFTSQISGNTLKSIKIQQTEANRTTGYITSVMVDDLKLIDLNQSDGILDEPINNYAVIDGDGTASSLPTLYGNTIIVGDGDVSGYSLMSQTLPTDKSLYMELVTMQNRADYVTPAPAFQGNFGIGLSTNTSNIQSVNPAAGPSVGTYGIYQYSSPNYYSTANGSAYTDTGVAFAPGDVIGLGYDGAGKIQIYVNASLATEIPVSTSDGEFTPYINAGRVAATGLWNCGQLGFAYANNEALGQGKVTRNGKTYDTLFTPITVATGSGDLFYIESMGEAVTATQLKRKFNLTAADVSKGIYPLTEQPTFRVKNYVKVGDAYQPVRDHMNELRDLRDLLKSTSTVWAQGESYVNGQIIHYGDQYFVVRDDYTVAADAVFDASSSYLAAIHS